MLKVTLHHGAPHQARAENVLGRLDIGYEKLAAFATYKAVMFVCGVGELAPVKLVDYPRWSGSVWDLVARIVNVSLSGQEELFPERMEERRTGAFIQKMSALVEHWPDGFSRGITLVGTASIQMCRRRCNYVATFTDDICGTKKSTVFRHTPKILVHWDLLARSYAYAFNDDEEMPRRPSLHQALPDDPIHGKFVLIDALREPARTGLSRWIARKGIETFEVEYIAGQCITEKHFRDFLNKAI